MHGRGTGQQAGLMFKVHMTMDLIELDPGAWGWAKREVAMIEGRMGRVGAKVWGVGLLPCRGSCQQG